MLHALGDGRGAYLYLIAGGLRLSDGEELATGDAVKAFGPETLAMHATAESELILVDVPATYTPVGVWAGPR